MKLLIFAASHRPNSFNRKLAKLAATHLAAQGVEIDFAEYTEFDMPAYNDTMDMPPGTDIFGKRAAEAQGMIISSPEYNWSYPGSLKTIIDWTSCMMPNPLAKKTALLLSASPGGRGGIMGLQHLKLPLESMQMFVFPKVFPMGNAERAFDKDNNLVDVKQRQGFTSLLDEYRVFTQKLTG